MADDSTRRPADTALLFGALFAVLLPTIFLVTPLAWWIWKQNWLGSIWLTRVLAVGSALIIPAVVLGAAWYGVRWLNNRGGGEDPVAAGPVSIPAQASAEPVVPTVTTVPTATVAPVVARRAEDAPGLDMPDLEEAAS